MMGILIRSLIMGSETNLGTLDLKMDPIAISERGFSYRIRLRNVIGKGQLQEESREVDQTTSMFVQIDFQ